MMHDAMSIPPWITERRINHIEPFTLFTCLGKSSIHNTHSIQFTFSQTTPILLNPISFHKSHSSSHFLLIP